MIGKTAFGLRRKVIIWVLNLVDLATTLILLLILTYWKPMWQLKLWSYFIEKGYMAQGWYVRTK